MKNKLSFLLLSLLTILYSCKDSETFVPDPAEQAFKASAFVEVLDGQGQPIQDAVVKILHNEGETVITNTYGTTNADGVYQLKNVDMYSSTYVTVSKTGYFGGSRRFYPVKNKSHFIAVRLLEKQLAGTFSSGTGGIVQVNDDVQLEFPYVGIVDANGQQYEGEVRVLAQAIPADDENLSTKMPGALVGINDNNEKGALGSMGMVNVELETPSGQPLQVKEGSDVRMKVKVPNSKISDAPATIDMWYFDEEAGYWVQEGTATLVGNEYVAMVPHFSFWNCDAWFELVKWGATFVFENGAPAAQVQVCLNILSMNSGACSATNEDGFVCGAVPANELMLLEVRSPCGQVLYSQQVGPYSDTTMIGPITLPNTSISLVNLTGNAIDCNGDPVTNGFVSIKTGDAKYYTNLDDVDGSFNYTILNCNQTDFTVTAYDITALKQSLTSTFPFANSVDVGTLTVCEDLTELVDIEAVGIPDHILHYFPEAYVQGGQTTMYTLDSLNGQYFYVRVNATSEGTYLSDASEIGFILPNGDRAQANGVTVTFTYFGDVGDYITGTVTGTFHTGPNGQGGPDYPLVGTFTILRE